jgi:hypothetical protein
MNAYVQLKLQVVFTMARSTFSVLPVSSCAALSEAFELVDKMLAVPFGVQAMIHLDKIFMIIAHRKGGPEIHATRD